MKEIWKPIPGHEGKYEVSCLGNVRSLTRRVRLVAHGRETTRVAKGVLLRPGKTQSGHVTVAIGRGNSRPVHQLVMEAFVGPRPEGNEVLHLNGNPSDNRLENLKYGTRRENILMDYATGVRFLSEEQRLKMFAGRKFCRTEMKK